MRKILLILTLWMPVLLWAAKPYTVVIDAGHGGKDPGAVGKTSREKDLNLRLALRTGELIRENYPDVKVVYTRSTDVFIPLQTRADIANKNKADLFISIHTNASESKDSRGVETFILGTEKMEKNLDVAMRENAVMKLEADYQTTYHGFDPNSIDSYIMFELLQNNYMDQSLQFATHIQDRFVKTLNRYDRGVRQAAFWVLLKTACPSVLFEMGFISNPEEEVFLNTDSAMTIMSRQLVDAFAAYTHRNQPILEALPEKVEPSLDLALENIAQTADKQSVVEERKNDKKAEKVTLYAVQICAAKSPIPPDDPRLKGYPAEMVQIGDWYKYYLYPSTVRSEAAAKQKELKAVFPDCWVFKFEK